MSTIRHSPTAPTDTRVLASNSTVGFHSHEDDQLIYASSGVLEMVVENGRWFTPATRAVWVPGGTVHHWQVHGSATIHLVGVPLHKRPRQLHAPVLVPVRPLLRELVITCSAPEIPASAAARRMLSVLVDQVHEAPQPAAMLPILYDPRLRDLQAIIEADMTEVPTLTQLGRRIGASERTLSRLFSDRAGMKFTVWRNQLRLHRANLLLAEGRTVTHVAAACGFSSASAFITTFRKVFGCTPGSLYH